MIYKSIGDHCINYVKYMWIKGAPKEILLDAIREFEKIVIFFEKKI